ncbi:hypothetical protein ABIB80_004545 [Bradyrhizobium sp. i1.15.2]|uniref:hypothetical protein n=1 Tax=Bradyrhizobium sp. i1.15.2 TaxID=3156362 RepID=UPI0033968D93
MLFFNREPVVDLDGEEYSKREGNAPTYSGGKRRSLSLDTVIGAWVNSVRIVISVLSAFIIWNPAYGAKNRLISAPFGACFGSLQKNKLLSRFEEIVQTRLLMKARVPKEIKMHDDFVGLTPRVVRESCGRPERSNRDQCRRRHWRNGR